MDRRAEFSYDNRHVTLNKSDLLVINKGTEYQYDGSDDLILAVLELMGRTFESVCDGVRRVIVCDSTQDRNEHFAAIRSIMRQMMLNQSYVLENDQEYSYLVFDYYDQY